MRMKCIISGCSHDGKVRRGMCQKHYTRAIRYGDPYRERPSLSDRFHAAYTKEENGCWIWRKALSSMGYGAIQLGVGVTGKAHRISWELANGPIPEGMYVMHSCDTPACVNPDHLSIGTVADNSRDMVARGRSLRGPKNPNVKLTPEQVQLALNRPEPATELAVVLGVNPETIRRIRRAESWVDDVSRTRAIYKRLTFAD